MGKKQSHLRLWIYDVISGTDQTTWSSSGNMNDLASKFRLANTSVPSQRQKSTDDEIVCTN